MGSKGPIMFLSLDCLSSILHETNANRYFGNLRVFCFPRKSGSHVEDILRCFRSEIRAETSASSSEKDQAPSFLAETEKTNDQKYPELFQGLVVPYYLFGPLLNMY